MMDALKSKKEYCDDVFLRCSTTRCPVFCNLSDYNRYYYACQRQGHPWFTLDRIEKMVCECGMTPTLSLTQSETNYGKMYLRCGHAIVSYSFGGDLNPTRVQCKFLRMDVNDSFQD